MLKQTYLAAAVCTAILLTGCDSSDSGDVAVVDTSATDTFDVRSLDSTSGDVAYLDLTSGARVISTDDWHLAYQKYVGFKVNGGTSGEGSVSGCIAHEYTALFDADGNAVQSEFEALTFDNTKSNFNAVTATSCTKFTEDGITAQIKTSDWLNASYSAEGVGTYTASDGASNGWIIKSADGESYARVSVSSLESEFITFKSELWSDNDNSFGDARSSVPTDFSNSTVYWDLETNDIVTESDDWDLSIKVEGRDYPIQVNGGASGDGSGGVGALIVDNAAAVTDPTDTTQVYKYFGDSAKGILSTPGSYGPLQYDVAGAHKMWPTFTTYLIKDESETTARYFKVQVISNYGEDGTAASGNLAFRTEEVFAE